MPALSECSNVENTAILVLERMGFRDWLNRQTSLYCCERDGWDFMAPSPCGLLGLVAIFEHKAATEHSNAKGLPIPYYDHGAFEATE